MSDSLAVKLEGTLQVLLSKGACEEEGVTNGPAFELGLRPKNTGVKQALGVISMIVETPNAFAALPIPPGTLGSVTMLSTGNTVFDVRLTFEDAATVTIAVCGLWLQEHDPDNRVTLVEVQGEGKISYLIAGGLA